MHPTLNIAVRAARAAGNIILRYADRLDTLTVREKSANDFVTEVDRQAEQAIIDILRRSFPDHAVLAEETGRQGAADFEWVIDPLDGTTNFLHGFPQFAVSIALRHRGRLEQAVVYDPTREELFTASRGQGARLNDRRMRVSGRTSLKGALLGTGIPFRNTEIFDGYLETLRAFMLKTAGIRRPGSAALDLAYVAAGRLDGFWEFRLNAWDIAAGVLLVKEAGGLVTDPAGGEDFFGSGDIVAGPPKVVRAMLATLRPCLDRVPLSPADA